MKDRPKGALTMQDAAIKLEKKRGEGKQKSAIILPDTQLIGVTPSSELDEKKSALNTQFDKYDEDVKWYNENIVDFNEEYIRFVPQRGVIVRCFLAEGKWTELGVYLKPNITVPVKTANGMTFKEYQDSPYPYSPKAVVVSVPRNYSTYKPGDIVILDRYVVQATKVNIEAPFHLPAGFTMPSWAEMEPPTDTKDPHYGYLLIENPIKHILGEHPDSFKNNETDERD